MITRKKHIFIIFVLLVFSSVCTTGILYAQPSGASLILPARSFSENNVNVFYHPKTNNVNFLSAKVGYSISRPEGFSEKADAEQVARAFLSRQGALFGVNNQVEELTVKRSKFASRDRSFVRFQQVYRDIPILGGELIVQLDAAKNIMSVNGEILPGLELKTTPSLSQKTAQQHALAKIAEIYELPVDDLIASEPELIIYDPILVSGVVSKAGSILVWHTVVTHQKLREINEFVLVDAQSGKIALHFKQIDAARNRLTYDMNNSETSGTLCRSEGQGPIGETDCDNAHDYAGDTYDYYQSEHGRDSIDNAGMTLKSFVHYSTGYCNAFWNGSEMVYGDGCFLVTDDVVAHELTHGVTGNESDLIYSYQSGAINESFSDIWGEFVDLTNGSGNDTSSVRWDVGEDASIGAIRDMQDPTIHGDPDRMLSSYYYCGADDNGGVHINSGVGNKAAYLLTDGDTFNDYTITGLGISKVADLFYEVQTNLLTSTADYGDLRNALNQACTNLGYTTPECQQVNNATLATEMDQTPCAGFGSSLDCTNAIALTSGVAYNGTTVGGNSHASSYSCVGFAESGPEKVHKITLTTDAPLEVTLSGMSVDLDLFILDACSENDCIAHSAGTGTESISSPSMAPGTYYIVVDEYAGASGSYTLTATSPGAEQNSYLLWTK